MQGSQRGKAGEGLHPCLCHSCLGREDQKVMDCLLGVVVHKCHLGTWGADKAGESLSLRLVWATEYIPCQPELLNGTVSGKQTPQKPQ